MVLYYHAFRSKQRQPFCPFLKNLEFSVNDLNKLPDKLEFKVKHRHKVDILISLNITSFLITLITSQGLYVDYQLPFAHFLQGKCFYYDFPGCYSVVALWQCWHISLIPQFLQSKTAITQISYKHVLFRGRLHDIHDLFNHEMG